MLKKIAIAIIVILAVIFGMAMMQPDTFTVTRSTTIKAPPEKIIPLVNDFHNWQAGRRGKSSTRTCSAASAARPAAPARSTNGTAITMSAGAAWKSPGSQLPSKVTIKLDFIEPFASSNVTQFTLVPQGDTTTVNWNMTGPMQFVTKIMSVFTSMDKMIGKDFEKGLAQMKAVAEK